LTTSINAGTKLGRYEIRSQLGAGGMGEVYLAQDTKLERTVALEILPGDVAVHSDRMRRFVQEAKAASALNHPNIITIYEIEQIDSVNFIATEFIDGETLRQRMKGAPMKLGEVLDVAIQTASALSAAHAAGIVHRDIKPENIMLRRDGIVKVLDFGLAKLTERLPPHSVDPEALTRVVVKTDAGVVMGTALYMSPEQARGISVDARTDIFSLGIVLYEMVAGQVVDLPVPKRGFRPSLTLQNALKLADGYIAKEKIDLSPYYFYEAKYILYGSKENRESCWFFWRVNENGTIGDYVEVIVSIKTRNVRRLPSM
jgi:serine/threonine protein kinase